MNTGTDASFLSRPTTRTTTAAAAAAVAAAGTDQERLDAALQIACDKDDKDEARRL